MKSLNPQISIIIPSWNNLDQLKNNLPAVYKASKNIKSEIIVVDDASTDNSLDYLHSQLGFITLIKNEENLGFGASVNLGVKRAKAKIIILLNTDVRPNSNCFNNCIPLFKDKNLFAIHFNSGQGWGRGQWQKGLFHHYRQLPKKNQAKDLNQSLWASGGQGAFSKDKWEELKGFDPLYKPFYWEDVDLGYRALKRGWKIIWSKNCKVEHIHTQSVIAKNFSKNYIYQIAQRNQLIFVWKNISDRKLIISHLFALPYYFLKYPRSVISAVVKLNSILTKRSIEKKEATLSDEEVISKWQT